MQQADFTHVYEKLRVYAENLIKLLKIKEGLVIDGMSPDDLVGEAFVNGCHDVESAKKPMQTYLFGEARRDKGKRQQGVISEGYEKKCKTCKKVKTANEFTVVYREEINYAYLKSNCKPCYATKAKEYRLRNPQTPKQKMKTKIRNKRYRERQKLKNHYHG